MILGEGLRTILAVRATFSGNSVHWAKTHYRRTRFTYAPVADIPNIDQIAIIMDHDDDVIRVVEGDCSAIKRSIIKVSFRRIELPDELRKIASVFVEASPAAFCGKIILVPPSDTVRSLNL